jgi:hypothetical protein
MRIPANAWTCAAGRGMVGPSEVSWGDGLEKRRQPFQDAVSDCPASNCDVDRAMELTEKHGLSAARRNY